LRDERRSTQRPPIAISRWNSAPVQGDQVAALVGRQQDHRRRLSDVIPLDRPVAWGRLVDAEPRVAQ
ncbi:MAG: hypothetical protein ACXWFU_15065, partial [Actinomycetota bacterium]